ncbi:MAG: hypothetical protein GXP39_01445 [Chloroflexi bacterium]|nr:hypothetical protein [Chloroflexota bacterium]
MWCHLLLSMPIIGLVLFVIFPLPLALPIYLAVALTSLALYRKIFRAMGQPVITGREGMIGVVAEVVSEVNPYGQIRYRGEVWSVVSSERLKPGQKVRITGFDGMKAIVEAVQPPEPGGDGSMAMSAPSGALSR